MTIVDTVRNYLTSKGSASIDGSMVSLAEDSKIPREKLYQALYRLHRAGELTMERIGEEYAIRLVKMAPKNKIENKVAEKARKKEKSFESITLISPNRFPTLTEYIKKKNIVVEVKERLLSAGFSNSDEMVSFELDPLAEEAITILDLVGQAQTAIQQLMRERDEYKFSWEAEKRNAEYLSNKVSEETRKELLAHANAQRI